jgi:hypothetical protein
LTARFIIAHGEARPKWCSDNLSAGATEKEFLIFCSFLSLGMNVPGFFVLRTWFRRWKGRVQDYRLPENLMNIPLQEEKK